MLDKRSISEVTPESDHDDKKLHTKPGRKQIDTEPKSKRTAQNRAAQRAYRERKERKMKDLEDKVKSLEDANVKAYTEADFLKAQVDMLKNELSRYRGHSDFSDLKLPTSVGALSSHKRLKSFMQHSGSTTTNSTNTDSSPSVSNSSPDSHKQISTYFPWSKDNLENLKNSGSSNQLPDLVQGGSLTSTSPLDDNILVSPQSQSLGDSNPGTVNSQQFDKFDEQVDPFCIKLSEACGTKQCPIPKYKREEQTNDTKDLTSPFATLIAGGSTSNTPSSDPFFNDASLGNYDFALGPDDANNDPLSFLNDNNFDVSLAFGDDFSNNKVTPTAEIKEEDPLAGLTTEESAYDMLDYPNTNFNFNEFVKSSIPLVSSRSNSINDSKSTLSSNTSYNTSTYPTITKVGPILEEADDNEVVPAPEATVRCSEIWDRITSHPKYTEIDIDGLCNELKSKAKCSEHGVVINSADVNQLIEQSAILKN